MDGDFKANAVSIPASPERSMGSRDQGAGGQIGPDVRARACEPDHDVAVDRGGTDLGLDASKGQPLRPAPEPGLEIEAADIAGRTIPTPYRFQKPRQLGIAGVDGQIEHIADGNQVDRAPDPNLAARRLQGQRQFRVQNVAVNDAA